MKLLSLLSLLFFQAGALAAADPVFSLSCPTAAQIDPFIMMCGHNKFIAIQARYCADELVNSWRAAAQTLVPVLQSRGREKNQSRSEADTSKNYRDAIRSIEEQILQMQHYTSVIADYPSVMIDVGGSHGDATSLSCFNEAFHQVQDIVSYLDDEIIRAKKVRESALALMSVSDSRQHSLATSLTEGAVKGGFLTPVPSGSSPRSASTITGEIRKEMLRSRSASARLDRKIPIVSNPPFTRQAGGGSREKEGILADFSSSTSLERGRPRADAARSRSVGATTSSDSNSSKSAQEVSQESKNFEKLQASAESAGRSVAANCRSEKVEVLSCTAELVSGTGSQRVFRVIAKVRNKLSRALRAQEPVVGIRAEARALLDAGLSAGEEGTARGDYRPGAQTPADLSTYFFAVSTLDGPVCAPSKKAQCTLIQR